MGVPDPAKAKEKLKQSIEAMKRVQEAARKVAEELKKPVSPQAERRV